jgi:acetyltransferase-like isoleucine patch superfamily enzyme
MISFILKIWAKILIKTTSILLLPFIFIKLKREKVEYDNIKCFNGIPFILNNGSLTIGEDVVINSDYKYNPIGGNTFTSFWIKKGGSIIIEKGAKISNTAFVAQKLIHVGKSVYVGGDCKIYDTDFHSLQYNERANANDSDIKSESVIIGDFSFIGSGSIILKGVSIGQHSVIGAGSVVTKSIPDYEIWAGNPARFIKVLK